MLKSVVGPVLRPVVRSIFDGFGTFAFSPASFFANGEQGWWYDPSNFSTLFQDSAGTTPVTAMEQPVGLQLDLSKGLVLGPELVTNGTFTTDTVGWTAQNAASLASVNSELRITSTGTNFPLAITSGAGISTVVGRTYVVTAVARRGTSVNPARVQVSGITGVSTTSTTNSAIKFFFTATNTNHFVELLIAGSASAGDTAFFDNVTVKELPGNHRFQTTSANRPVVSARVNLFVGTATLATQSVTTRATTHTLTFTGAGSITLTGTAIGVYTAGTYSVTTTAGTLTATVLGTVTQADLRETNVGVGLPAYQSVVTSTNYDSTGFPVYIKPNGSNQFMVTNSINFTATDKMTVWQGVRHQNTAATGVLTELSANAGSNNGTLAFFLNTTSYSWRSRGTSDSTATSSVTPPITNVLTGIGDISGDQATLRANGTQVATSSADQGTGNYGTYPAYFYMRGGSSLPFNGNDYGSIARGAASTAAQIMAGETYINSKTKAY